MKYKKRIYIITIIILIGAVCFIFGAEELSRHNEPLGISYIALAVGILSVLLGIISLYISDESLDISKKSKEISEESRKIADDSDKKMEAIANAHFIEIYEEIQNITLREILPKITEDTQEANNLRGAYVWKYSHSLERGILLKEWADESQRANLVIPFDTLLKGIPWGKQMLENKDIRDLLDGYLLIKDLDIPNNIVEDIEDLIEKTIIERKKDESIIECINRTKSELDKKPNMKFKSPHY